MHYIMYLYTYTANCDSITIIIVALKMCIRCVVIVDIVLLFKTTVSREFVSSPLVSLFPLMLVSLM